MKTYQIIPKCTFIFHFCLYTVLYCFHWKHQQVERVQSAHGGSLRYEGIGLIQNRICYSQRGERFHWKHQQVERVQSAHGGSLRYEGIGQIQNWYVILKEENLGFHLNINLSAILENFLNYTPVYIHISFFSLHCIVLFPLKAPASWTSAKCTRRLFKVWRNWPNSKLICYSQRGEPRLSFEYKFVGHSWKLLKLYPSVHSYFFFFFTLYCIVSTESTSKLNECKVHTEAL